MSAAVLLSRSIHIAYQAAINMHVWQQASSTQQAARVAAVVLPSRDLHEGNLLRRVRVRSNAEGMQLSGKQLPDRVVQARATACRPAFD